MAAIEDPTFNGNHETYQVLGACEFDSNPELAVGYYEKAVAEQPWVGKAMIPCHRNLVKVLNKVGNKDRAREVEAQLARLEEEDKTPGG